jgi:hypothetical protein
VALALIIKKFGPFQRFSLDIQLHNTYWAICLHTIGFWLLMGIAAVWLIITAYKFNRHSS